MNSQLYHYSLNDIKKNFLPQLLRHVANPSVELSHMLSHIADISRVDYIANESIEISLSQYKILAHTVSERCKGVPLAYLIKNWDFLGKTYHVSPDVLIPRPETELLVKTAIDIIEEISSSHSYQDMWMTSLSPHILDCGTGSGCIGISLYMYLKEHLSSSIREKSWKISISDISSKSLEIAKKNLINIIPSEYLTKDKINIFQGNLLDITPLEEPKIVSSIPIGIVLANLPYVSHAHLSMSPSLMYEPALALEGSEDNIDGTKYIELLFAQAHIKLPHPHILILEADPLQFDKLSYLAAIHKYTTQHSILDIRKLPRIFYCIKA